MRCVQRVALDRRRALGARAPSAHRRGPGAVDLVARRRRDLLVRRVVGLHRRAVGPPAARRRSLWHQRPLPALPHAGRCVDLRRRRASRALARPRPSAGRRSARRRRALRDLRRPPPSPDHARGRAGTPVPHAYGPGVDPPARRRPRPERASRRHRRRAVHAARRRQRAPRPRRRLRAPAARRDAAVRQPHHVLGHARQHHETSSAGWSALAGDPAGGRLPQR